MLTYHKVCGQDLCHKKRRKLFRQSIMLFFVCFLGTKVFLSMGQQSEEEEREKEREHENRCGRAKWPGTCFFYSPLVGFAEIHIFCTSEFLKQQTTLVVTSNVKLVMS